MTEQDGSTSGEPTDFRSSRMPSVEGHGRARDGFRRAWATYERAVNKTITPMVGPFIEPLAHKLAGAAVVDLTGFWLVWHLEGGFEGLQRLGLSRAAIYRRIALFRRAYGLHPDEFVFDGVTIDLDAYLAGRGKPVGDRSTHPAQSQHLD